MPRIKPIRKAATAAPPPLQELRPQRLSFVGGTLLGWGLALAGLHATLKNLQAPGVSALRDFESNGKASLLDYAAAHFYVLSILVAIGAAMLVVCTAYLCAHGMALREGQAAPPRARLLVDLLFDGFVWLFRYALALALFSIPVMYLAVALDRALVLRIGLSVEWAAMLTRWTLTATVLAGVWFWMARQARREGLKDIVEWMARWNGDEAQYMRRTYMLVAMSVLVGLCSVAVVDTAYVAEVSVAKALYEKNKDTWVEVTTTLSGMSSDPAEASLLLRMPGRREQQIPLNIQAGKGRYVAVLPVQSLPAGTYELTLLYAGKSWSGIALLDQRIERRVGFLVVP